MTQIFSKNMLTYALIVFAILFIAGFVLSPVVTNIYVLIAVLVIVFIALTIFFIYLSEKYVRPLIKISHTMDKILRGNYHARIQYSSADTVGELSAKINELARNLSELTILEQMQAEQLSTVIENSTSGLVLIDEKGYIHFVNRKILSIFGKTPQDYIGYLYYEALNPVQIHDTIQQTFLSEKNEKQFFSVMEADKATVFLELVVAPIFNERNLLKGAVLVMNDITEFKQLEAMRKDFVANVSHELKTPVTSIRGFAETLLDGAAEDKEAREQFLHIIFQESKRIQLLIEDLLILSKMEHDEPKLVFTEVSLDQLIGEMMPLLEQRARQGGIKLVVNELPHAYVTADEEKLKQILLNLYMNAVNYTPKNGTVTISLRETEDYICLMVEDTGIGMEQDVLPRIFERFYRVDKDRSRKTGGTGLGLAIVKHIVEVHCGKMDVKSEVGVGSTFTVMLPKQM